MKNLLFIILLFTCGKSFSQTIDYNKIILPSEVKNVSIEEKLIQLAWTNYPENQIFKNNIEVAKKTAPQAGWQWLDGFRATFNVNEFTLNPDADVAGRSAFFPRYNLSASLSLGDFVQTPLEVQKSRINLENEKQKLNAQKLRIRAEVLTAYYTYLEKKEILKIQTAISEELFSKYTAAESDFKNGIISFAEYSETLEQYQGQKQNSISSKYNFEISRVNLEQLIGVDINSVIVD